MPGKTLTATYYNPDHQHLFNLGYKPTHDIEQEMKIVLNDLMKYRNRIEARKEALIPDIRWDGKRKKVHYLSELTILKEGET